MKFTALPLVCCGVIMMAACTEKPSAPQAPPPPELPYRNLARVDSLAIDVSPEENRAVSFTNKRSAYYYTQSHRNDHEEHAAFRGLNVAQKRVFSDLVILPRDTPLDPVQAQVRVYPDRMERNYPGGVQESLRLVEHEDIVEVKVTGAPGATVTPAGEGVRLLEEQDDLRVYSTMELPDKVIVVGSKAHRHFILLADNVVEARARFVQAVEESSNRAAGRVRRMARLLNENGFVETGDKNLTQALRWLAITMDQLVTRQRGDGIYAGLPWFNEYWGRDSFIALPGALLVTGEFETARAVLTSFAEFMDMDPSSQFYGRVPNRVRTADLDYHTTDGTPRFVNALHDYVRYSGDTSIVQELYPKVRASIEGALANWTDGSGYLTHAENETWMDARRASDLKAYSPRDTRANDIQALWHGQLLAGVYFARVTGDTGSAARWQEAADRLAERFEQDFTSPGYPYLADRLDAEDVADFSLRPNQFYAFDMLTDEMAVARATRAAWENLVYPWGVASLAASDPFFHPYHLAWRHYHKDEAYHNGTVWLWNNGIAMQRMIEMGQVGPAWALFQNMNRQVLERGVVGGLAENADAYPHPGEALPRLTGTYLQAWSNSEQLRAWYQHFLGVQPDLVAGTVTLAPRLPRDFDSVDYTVRVGDGKLRGVYGVQADAWSWELSGLDSAVSIDLPGFEPLVLDMANGERIDAEVVGEALNWFHWDADGALRAQGTTAANPELQARQAGLDMLFEGVDFARPGDAREHPAMRKTYDGNRNL